MFEALMLQNAYSDWTAQYPWLPWFFTGSLLFAIIGWFVGNAKGGGCLGCILGGLLGPFGLLITVLTGKRD